MAGLTSRVSSPADGPAGRAHRAAAALLAALAAFVALPSANYLVFAGVPFDSLLVTSVFGLVWSFPTGKGRLRAVLSVSAAA